MVFWESNHVSLREGLPHDGHVPQAPLCRSSPCWRHGDDHPLTDRPTVDGTTPAGQHTRPGFMQISPRGWRCIDRHRHAGPFFALVAVMLIELLQTPAAWLRLRHDFHDHRPEMASIDLPSRTDRPYSAPRRRAPSAV
jgi:hypothetical protein